MCGYEIKRAVQIATLPIHVKFTDVCTLSHTPILPTLFLYIMKLWNMNVYTKAKVLLKFGGLESMCVDMRSKKLFKLPHYRYMGCTCMYALNIILSQ